MFTFLGVILISPILVMAENTSSTGPGIFQMEYDEINPNLNDEHTNQAPWTEYYEERCLRRFNPGTCAEPQQPVYTYTYLMHNCTVRLGCPASSRSNRFRTYSLCARVCQSYMQLWIAFIKNENEVILEPEEEHTESRRRLHKLMSSVNRAKQKDYLNTQEFDEEKRRHELTKASWAKEYEPSEVNNLDYGDVPQKFESYL